MTFSQLEMLCAAHNRRRAAEASVLANIVTLGAAAGFGSRDAATKLEAMINRMLGRNDA